MEQRRREKKIEEISEGRDERRQKEEMQKEARDEKIIQKQEARS